MPSKEEHSNGARNAFRAVGIDSNKTASVLELGALLICTVHTLLLTPILEL